MSSADFDNSHSGRVLVDDEDKERTGVGCTSDVEGEFCASDSTNVRTITWEDDNAQVTYGQVTSCGLGYPASMSKHQSLAIFVSEL